MNNIEKKIDNKLNNIQKAFGYVFGDLIYSVLAVSLGLNFVALDYILLTQVTTFRILSSQNTAFYNWASIILSITTAILFGISIAMLVYVFKKNKENAKESAPSSLFGAIFGAVASGCPVCGAWLLPILGIAGSLSVFPFQGLEIKVLAIILLLFSIFQSTNIVLGVCKSDNKNVKKRINTTIAVIFIFVAILFLLPYLPQKYKIKFQQTGVSAPTVDDLALEANLNDIFEQVNPKAGFTINANYGNIGYRLVNDGVIDFEKFKSVYDRAGVPLTKEQLSVFEKGGLDKPITINRENSYFLLNFFWALGIANDNSILTEGQITKYGKGKIGNFASTGGWTIATKPLGEYFSKSQIASITEDQQKILQRVAENTYRPCCGNSTAFPDCNHGMALLGMLELMASNGATESEMFDAAKYFSAFWFPSQAVDVATYFKVTKNEDFKDIDSKVFVSEQFFSGRGWSGLKGWLEKNLGSVDQVESSGGGCGVDSGAPVQKTQTQKTQTRTIAPRGGSGCGV
jgi:hypothetical protein